MFIIKFNKMVTNKWIWAAFAIIVAAAFAASDILFSANRSETASAGIGFLQEKEVDPVIYNIISNMMQEELNRSSNAADDEALPQVKTRDIWKRYAAYQKATELGLRLSDRELAYMIQRMFSDESGAFNKALYEQFVRYSGKSVVEFQEQFRISQTLGKLEAIISGSAFVPPAIEVDRTHGRTDIYTLITASLENTHSATNTAVTTEQIQSYYENHKDIFTIPERRVVEYVRFASKDYLDQVKLDEEEVLAYYDDNTDRFVEKDADGKEVAKELEEVRPEIEKTLSEEKARELAGNAASLFADLFYDKKEIPDFTAAAVEAGYKTVTNNQVSATYAPVHYQVMNEFCEAVFSLSTEEPSMSVSDVLGIDNSECYVARLMEITPSRLQTLDEVRSTVERKTKEDAAKMAFQEDINAVEQAFQRIEPGKSFADVAKEMKLTVGTNLTINVADALAGKKWTDVPGLQQMAIGMTELNAGEISAQSINLGASAVFYQVVSREPGDQATFSGSRTILRQSIMSQLSSAIWEDWLEKNLLSMNPQPIYSWETDTEEDIYEE